jgi:hypothetical protein
MDRAANLLNDPNKTDYKYTVMLPYLNLAIEEYSDLMAEANTPVSNMTSTNNTLPPIIIPVGVAFITIAESAIVGAPKYPDDLIEIQEVGERQQGSLGPFIRLERREFPMAYPATNSLLFWYWERSIIRFNDNGATTPMEIELKYLSQGAPYVATPDELIFAVGARTYLAYKTAALCAMFIGENESRAEVLERQAEKAIERATSISNKGRQQIVTRHRPFRASYKSRGF